MTGAATALPQAWLCPDLLQHTVTASLAAAALCALLPACALRSSLVHAPACYHCAAQLHLPNLHTMLCMRQLCPCLLPHAAWFHLMVLQPPAFLVALQLSLSSCRLGAQLTASLHRSGQGCRPCLRGSFVTQLIKPSRGGILWSPASSHCTLSQASVWQSGACGTCPASQGSWPEASCRRCRLQQPHGVCYPCCW